MKNVVACLAFVLLPACYAFAQTEQAVKLKTFFDQHATEKAYLHFDKPYYAAGDTIYFKAYVVAGEKNNLSPLSGVLYADLINPQNKIATTLRLPVIDGLAWGDFALADSLPAGNYRVRAYTKLMQSYGSELFFDRVLPIASAVQKKSEKTERPSIVKTDAPDIQFFAEGGQLVPGVGTNIACKALRSDGTGIEAKGTITNNANKIVGRFATTHLGMGTFNLAPKTGENYSAQVTFADGSRSSIALPAADSNAIALAVDNTTQRLTIAINAGNGFFHANKDQQFNLLFYSGGKLTTFSDKLTNREMKFELNKNRLKSGITQITLTTADGLPLCERLVFINNNDNLNIDALTNRAVYQPRGQVTVKVHVQNQGGAPAGGHFSVAVIDKGKVEIDEDKEENILTYLLLTSGLKGYIEAPGYYFNNIDNDKRKNLDLVMLTHGYRRFTWKSVMNDEIPPVAIKPEKALSLSGVAKAESGKPLNNGHITLIPSAGGALLSQKTDNTGAFRFDNLAFYDTTRFVLNAVNAKGKDNTMLIYKPDPAAPVAPYLYASNDTTAAATIQAYLQNSQKQHTEYLKYYGKGIQLKEVKVQSVKKPSYKTQSLAGAGNADVLIKGNTLPKAGMLATALAGRIGGVFFTGADNPNGGGPKMQIGSGPMLVIVDGVQRIAPPGQTVGINDIYPGEVETIEVLKYASAAIYGMSGGNGVIIITTKRGVGRDPNEIASHGVLPLTITGFYKAREFYAPRYDRINDHIRPDLRSTIHWIPELVTDKDGNASFDFYNADGTGQYQIVIEGINADGTAGAAKFTYEVKE